MSNTSKRRLLDEVRDVMRLHHYSIHTERTYCDWIKRFVLFHKMASREDLKNGEAEIEKFLTHPAIDQNVSASTQNLAMNALVFLYKHVLKEPLDKEINAVRAPRKVTVPVVMTREEVVQVIHDLHPCAGTRCYGGAEPAGSGILGSGRRAGDE